MSACYILSIEWIIVSEKQKLDLSDHKKDNNTWFTLKSCSCVKKTSQAHYNLGVSVIKVFIVTNTMKLRFNVGGFHPQTVLPIKF